MLVRTLVCLQTRTRSVVTLCITLQLSSQLFSWHFAIRYPDRIPVAPILGFSVVAYPWLPDQAFHSGEHLLGSRADVNV